MQNLINSLSGFFSKNKRFAVLILLFTILFGSLSYTTFLKREGFPDASLPVSVLSVDYPIFDSLLMEKDITTPIENLLLQNSNVEKISTYTFDNGVSVVTTLNDGVNGKDFEKEVLDEIKTLNLPTGAEVKFRDISISKFLGKYDLVLTLSSKKLDYSTLETSANKFAEELKKIESVVLADIIPNSEQVNNLATGKEETQIIRFSRVGIHSEEKINFEDAIYIGISKSVNKSDLVRLSDNILETVSESKNLNDIEVSYGSDPSSSVKEQISSLEKNAIDGIFIVSLVLFLFVSFRSSIIILFFIPLVMCATLITLYLTGNSLNTISLFALILVLGLLVDDAIVVIEAIDSKRQEGLSSIASVKEALSEVGIADISGTLTTMLVFVPMLAITGVLGEFINLIPFTVIVTLGFSLFFALSIIPLASGIFLKKITKGFREQILATLYLLTLVLIYFLVTKGNLSIIILLAYLLIVIVNFLVKLKTKNVLLEKINHSLFFANHLFINLVENISSSIFRFFNYIFGTKKRTMFSLILLPFFTFILIFISFLFSFQLKFSIFSSPKDSDFLALAIDVDFIKIYGKQANLLTENQKLEKTLEIVQKIEEKISLDSSKYIKQVDYNGNGLGIDSNEILATVELVEFSERKIAATELVKSFNDNFLNFSDAKVTFSISSAGPPSSGFPFAMQIFANDKKVLEDIQSDLSTFVKGIELEVDQTPLLNLSNSLFGKESSFVERVVDTKIDPLFTINKLNSRRFAEFKAGFSDNSNSTLVNLLETKIREEYLTPRLVLTEENKSILTTKGIQYNEIELEKVGDEITKNGLNKDDFIKTKLEEKFGLNPANSFEFDFGQETENQESFSSLGSAFVISLVVMYALLVLQYNSFSQPLLVFLAIPLTFPALFPGLYFTNNPLSFFVMLGLLGLTGIVVNNSIMLIDFANSEKKKGANEVDAILLAVKKRIRPILVTTSTTIAGLLPLALSEPFWEGLAFSLIFGLISSSLLIVFSLPSFYIIFEKFRKILKRLFK